MLGTGPRSSARIASVLTCSPISPAQSLLLCRGPELSSSKSMLGSSRGSDQSSASMSARICMQRHTAAHVNNEKVMLGGDWLVEYESNCRKPWVQFLVFCELGLVNTPEGPGTQEVSHRYSGRPCTALGRVSKLVPSLHQSSHLSLQLLGPSSSGLRGLCTHLCTWTSEAAIGRFLTCSQHYYFFIFLRQSQWIAQAGLGLTGICLPLPS